MSRAFSYAVKNLSLGERERRTHADFSGKPDSLCFQRNHFCDLWLATCTIGSRETWNPAAGVQDWKVSAVFVACRVCVARIHKGDSVTRAALLKKLDAVMAEAERTGMWGNIEIEIRNGEGVLLRKSTTEKLTTENNRHEYNR